MFPAAVWQQETLFDGILIAYLKSALVTQGGKILLHFFKVVDLLQKEDDAG